MNETNVNNTDFALGGIAAGFLALDSSAKVTRFCPAPGREDKSPIGITLKVDGKEYSLIGGHNNVDFRESFPFCIYKMSFERIDVTFTAFNPFLPLNCADSQIPAVLFCVQTCNNSEKSVNVTLNAELYDIFQSNGNFSDGVNSICVKCDGEKCFTLEAGQSKTSKLCLAWYFPYDNDCELKKNYYSQYFTDANECALYCIKHFDRLKMQSFDFSKMLCSTTVPNRELEDVINEIKLLKKMPLVRKNNGTVYCVGGEKKLAVEYAKISSLVYLLPELDRECVQYLLKNIDYTDVQMRLFSVLCAYRSFINSADVDELIENWYYISKSIDVQELCPDDQHFPLYTVSLYACCVMSQAVKDRARKSRYEKQYILSKKALLALEFDIPYELKSICFDIGCKELCCDFTPMGMSLLYQKSGFEYDAYAGKLCVCPKENYFDDSYEFKSFYCVLGGYGYIQAGVDSIEILPVTGKMSLRSIKVPRKPRMVLYGGRKWRFTEKDGEVVLDNVLEITQDKKLCIIVDAAKTI